MRSPQRGSLRISIAPWRWAAVTVINPFSSIISSRDKEKLKIVFTYFLFFFPPKGGFCNFGSSYHTYHMRYCNADIPDFLDLFLYNRRKWHCVDYFYYVSSLKVSNWKIPSPSQLFRPPIHDESNCS